VGDFVPESIVKILIVEDDLKIAAGLRRGLEHEGFTVDVALNGDDGFWMATEGGYDVIVLDIMLPGMNGYEICRDLRTAGDWTPVLMLTAKSGELDEAEALDTGADDYVTKPFAFVALVARIRALLRRSSGRDPAPIAAGDLRIDPVQRRTWRGDVEIELTTRQFDVLEFFVRRAGQVVSKADVLTGVWSYDFEGDPNIVEVYVKRLRKRIDEPFGRRAIETIRGAGYRLAVDGG
jgi:DNA-binding response OmpR family regulator